MMGSSSLRGAVPENIKSIGHESAVELRPGGMLVQKRDDIVGEQQGLDGSSYTIKVSHGTVIVDIAVSSTSTFGDAKRVIAQEVGVDPEMQKLFFRGKEKEDCDYLQMAGVRNNSKVLLVEDTREKASCKEMHETSEISRGSEAVAEVRAEVDMLAEKVSRIQAVNGGLKIDEKHITYLTEMLMSQLLKLDAIDAAGEGKRQRKTEVRRVQSFVEAMDALKARNSNPFSGYSNTVTVTTDWEEFDSGVGSLAALAPASASKVTQDQEWEPFD